MGRLVPRHEVFAQMAAAWKSFVPLGGKQTVMMVVMLASTVSQAGVLNRNTLEELPSRYVGGIGPDKLVPANDNTDAGSEGTMPEMLLLESSCLHR